MIWSYSGWTHLIISKTVLYICNGILMIIGVVITIMGALLAWSSVWFKSSVNSFVAIYSEKVNPVEADELLAALQEASKTSGIAIFIFGLVIILTTLLVIPGLCCECLILLYMYNGLLIALAIASLGTIVVLLAHPDMYGCCGVENPKDFLKMECNDVINGIEFKSITYPYFCCKLDENLTRIDNSCPYRFTVTNSVSNTPCGMLIKSHVWKILSYIAIFMAFLLVFIMAIIVISVLTTASI